MHFTFPENRIFKMKYKAKINVLPKCEKNNEHVPQASQAAYYACMDLIIFAQCIGLFPVENIRRPEVVKFKWFSLKMLYSVLLLAMFLLISVTSWHQALRSEMFLYHLISPLSYVHICGTIILFIKMSKQWPKFIKKASVLDESFVKRHKCSTNLRKKINLIVITVITTATVEHCLETTNFIFTNNCENDSTGLEYYLRKQFHYIFDYIAYNTSLGILLLVANWIGSYIWNFGDVFIVAMCVILTTRFEQIKAKIDFHIKSTFCQERKVFKIYSTENQDTEVKFWREIREDYNIINKLCEKINVLLSDLILLDYASNLSFILFQLFIGLRQREKLVEMVYFYFSFGYVVLRTVLLCIYGGWLYEASKAPLPMLNAVPTEIYNEEISRLIQQIHGDAPCLTGHNYFTITKGLVLSVAAAIITYELVLIQFSQVTPQIHNNSNQSSCF